MNYDQDFFLRSLLLYLGVIHETYYLVRLLARGRLREKGIEWKRKIPDSRVAIVSVTYSMNSALYYKK